MSLLGSMYIHVGTYVGLVSHDIHGSRPPWGPCEYIDTSVIGVSYILFDSRFEYIELGEG